MRKASLNDEVTAFDVAEAAHSLAEKLHIRVRRGGRRQIANRHRLYGLLRARRQRPCGCATEQRDEVAPLHSITSSARASSEGGTVRAKARRGGSHTPTLDPRARLA